MQRFRAAGHTLSIICSIGFRVREILRKVMIEVYAYTTALLLQFLNIH